MKKKFTLLPAQRKRCSRRCTYIHAVWRYGSVQYAFVTWISLEARSLSYSWVSCGQVSQCFQRFAWLISWFFWVKPCTEDLLPMRIGLWQGSEREPAPAQAARARRCLQETTGMWLDVIQVPACYFPPAPSGLCEVCGDLIPLWFGEGRGSRCNTCCELAHKKLHIFTSLLMIRPQ